MWVERSGPDGVQHRDRVLADGYVDLVFGRRLWVRGPDTTAHTIRYPAGSTFVGLRFRPGAAVGILGIPVSELVDDRVFLRELWGGEADELEERLAGARSEVAAALLEEAVAARVGPLDPAVEAVVSILQRKSLRIRTLAEWLGLSERQLLRRSTVALGYGPKTFERILRFQRFRKLASSRPRTNLAQLAALAGYADQPHLTRECRRLGGAGPSAFLV